MIYLKTQDVTRGGELLLLYIAIALWESRVRGLSHTMLLVHVLCIGNEPLTLDEISMGYTFLYRNYHFGKQSIKYCLTLALRIHHTPQIHVLKRLRVSHFINIKKIPKVTKCPYILHCNALHPSIAICANDTSSVDKPFEMPTSE